jgi:hypothetical protein
MATPGAFSEKEIRMMSFLAQNPNFASSTTVREQCYWACELTAQLFAETGDIRSKMPFASIGRILGVNRGHVSMNWNLFKKQGNDNKKPGRPCVLTHEEHEIIVNEILGAFHRHRPLTLHEVCRIIEDQFGKDV